MTRQFDFATRLAIARRLIAHGPTDVPVHLADQITAAGAETRVLHDHLGALLPALDPGRNWRQRLDAEPSDDTRAYLLAALVGCTGVCVHLRRGGPQPSIARLPLRRVDCERCSQTLWRTATAEDECDVCGRRGVTTFHPFAVRQGPVLIMGDACLTCALSLGIATGVSA